MSVNTVITNLTKLPAIMPKRNGIIVIKRDYNNELTCLSVQITEIDFGFPYAEISKGETPFENACRAIEEVSGIRSNQLRVLPNIYLMESHIDDKNDQFAGYYVAEFIGPQDYRPHIAPEDYRPRGGSFMQINWAGISLAKRFLAKMDSTVGPSQPRIHANRKQLLKIACQSVELF